MAAKLTTLLIVALLVCFTTLIFAARPNPEFHHESKEIEDGQKEVDATESCQDLVEETCLMRRTLVAHTDYIYTQHLNP